MQVETRELGQVQVPDDRLLRFVAPILGFEEHRRFALVDDARAKPFMWLQSLSSRQVAFPVVDAESMGLEYRDIITPELCEQVHVASPDKLRILLLAIIPKDVRQMRLNLTGPILVNEALALAGQFVIEATQAEVAEAAPATKDAAFVLTS